MQGSDSYPDVNKLNTRWSPTCRIRCTNGACNGNTLHKSRCYCANWQSRGLYRIRNPCLRLLATPSSAVPHTTWSRLFSFSLIIFLFASLVIDYYWWSLPYFCPLSESWRGHHHVLHAIFDYLGDMGPHGRSRPSRGPLKLFLGRWSKKRIVRMYDKECLTYIKWHHPINYVVQEFVQQHNVIQKM